VAGIGTPGHRREPVEAALRRTRMSRIRPAAVLVAAVLAAAGCGSAASSATTGSAPATVSGSPDPLTPPPHPAAARTPLPVVPATSSGTTGQDVSLGWDYLGSRDDGQTLELGVEVFGCLRLLGVQVGQSPSAVSVTMLGVRPPLGTHVACPDIARVVAGTVRLAQPLGHRQLLHAPLTTGTTSPVPPTRLPTVGPGAVRGGTGRG